MRIAYLHGFVGAPGAWNAIRRVLPGHAIALPGHGGPPLMSTWDANLAAVADTIGECDLVVGYSLGARIALGLVVTGRMPRAIVISVNPGIDDDARAARRVVDAGWATMLRERGLATFLDAWEGQPLFATQARVPTAQRDARRARRLTLDPVELARSLEVMGLAEMPDYRADVGRAADRIAVIAGADDAKYLAIARSLDVSLEVIESCGHDPTLEQPEALAAAIERLLSFRDRR